MIEKSTIIVDTELIHDRDQTFAGDLGQPNIETGLAEERRQMRIDRTGVKRTHKRQMSAIAFDRRFLSRAEFSQ